MLHKIYIFILIVFFSVTLKMEKNVYSQTKEPIKIAFYENFAPFSFKQYGKTKGIFVDVSNLILHDMMGYDIQVDSFPWGRAQDMVINGDFKAHITTKTSEREAFLLFQDSEIITSEVALVYSKNNKRINDILKISNKQELKNFKLVGYIGDGWSKEHFHDDKDVKFIRTANLINVLRMINENSADIYVSNSEKSDKYFAKKYGFKNLRYKKINFIQPGSVHYYFCLKKDYPNSVKIIKEFEKNYLLSKKSGKIESIFRKYF